MDTRPLATDVSKAGNTIRGFGRTVASVKVGVSDMANNVAASMGRTVLMFLSVEKVLGKIRKSFTDLANTKGMPALDNVLSRITKMDRAGALAFRDAFKEINLELEAFILKAASGMAPALNVAVANATALLAPLIGANDALKSMEGIVNGISAQWANLQQLVSGVALTLRSISGMGIINDTIMNGGDVTQALEANIELFKEGQKMFARGLSGEAGLDVLKQIEAEKKRINSTVFIDVDLSKLKKAEKLKIPDIHPGALEKGSAASVSAILKIDREKKGKETEKLLKEQIKILKQIEKKGRHVEIVAIL